MLRVYVVFWQPALDKWAYALIVKYANSHKTIFRLFYTDNSMIWQNKPPKKKKN